MWLAGFEPTVYYSRPLDSELLPGAAPGLLMLLLIALWESRPDAMLHIWPRACDLH